MTRAALLCSAILLTVTTARAQQQVFRSTSELVVVPVSVTDQSGRVVTGLRAEDFSLFEDGVRRPIRQFAFEHVPISITAVLDVSGSMEGPRLRDAVDAIRLLVTSLTPEDEFSVVTFNDAAQVLVPWTMDQGALTALAGLKANGGTALHAGVERGLGVLRQSEWLRRALVIISDGVDTAANSALADVRRLRLVNELGRTESTAYAIAAATPNGERVRDLALRELTDFTGGFTQVVDSSARLPEAMTRVVKDLRTQYLLAFEPAASDTRRHRIRVETTNRQHRVRARATFTRQ